MSEKFYCPYRTADDGGYMPYSAKYWLDQIKTNGPRDNASYRDGYRNLYEYFKSEEKMSDMLKSSMEEVIAKATFPIGTIHQYKGTNFKKMGPGDWRPVSNGKSNPVEDDAAKRRQAIEKELIARKNGESQEPDFSKKKQDADNKAADHSKREQELDQREKELDQKEHDLKSRELETTAKKKEAKASGGVKNREGLISNGMTDEAYTKPGGSLTMPETEKFISEFEDDFEKLSALGAELKKAGATDYAGRLKDPHSLYEKMTVRKPDRSLDSMTDIIGLRALTDSIEDQKSVLKKLSSLYDTADLEEMVDKPRDDGYRAVHAIIKLPSGKTAEVQIKTHLQQIFSGFTHDAIYKGKPEIKNDKGTRKFVNDLSSYLYKLDKGKDPGERPLEPPILMESGITFPWEDVDQYLGSRVAKKSFFEKAERPIKYFVVIREKGTKKNVDVKQFDDMNGAKAFRDKLKQSGHEGELPIGYAKSKEEFLQTFTEYRPQGPGSRGGQFIGFSSGGHPKYAPKGGKR